MAGTGMMLDFFLLVMNAMRVLSILNVQQNWQFYPRYDMNMLSSTHNFFVRNIRHNDQFCPYDMPDGWEYLDSNNNWKEDTTITVSCVRQ